MKRSLITLFLLIGIGMQSNVLFAQTVMPIDTTIDISKAADSTVKKLALPVNVPVLPGGNNVFQNKLQNFDLSKTGGKLKSAAKNGFSKATSSLDDRLKLPSKKSVAFQITLENDTRYQPPNPVASTYAINQKFVSIFNVNGLVDAWGVPLNLNFSSDRSPYSAMSGFNHNLFKFDFDPKQFSNTFKSDIDQYYNLRKNVLGGLDLSGYTSKALTDKLKQNAKQVADKNTSTNDALNKYLSNSSNVSQLLQMNDQQVKEKLKEVAATQGSDLTKTYGTDAIASGKLPADTKQLAISKLSEQQKNSYADSSTVSNYLQDPAKLAQLQSMSKSQISEKLTGVIEDKGMPATYTDNFSVYVPVADIDISDYVKEKITERQNSKKAKMDEFAEKILQAKKSGQPLSFIRSQTADGKLVGNSNVRNDDVNGTVDSMANTIAGIKAKLHKQGFDADKMAQMQNYLNGPSGKTMLSEQESNFLAKRPANGMQSFFSNVQAFKIGSFGDQVAGNTENKDLFITGTTATFKSGAIPITLGYGVMNDIGSPKDVGYQGSIYNSPKNITYFGTALKGPGGVVKISIIGAVNREISNSSYTIPTSSSNNVALTLTKDVSLGNLGDVSVDVSKSTTLFNNNYQIGSEAILNKKGGLDANLGPDLLEALSFGFNHHLDLKDLDASDNVYFNYSGMGYQNPGNNGFGGAKMKFGGNVKKSFYKNKLNFTLRTDISNMPISYTSDDKWKSANIQLDSRYIVSRKFNISLKYSNLSTDKKIDGSITPVYSFQKMQMDGNLNYKIGRNYSVTHLSFGMQSFSNSYVAASAGKLLMINYTQSVILHENSLTTTIFYNKELAALQIIGNMLTSDVTYQYKMFGKLNMSSAVTYLANSGIARQTGVRQGVQLYANSHFDFDSYVDLRKNLITPLYPDLYSACRAELSLKYHLKN